VTALSANITTRAEEVLARCRRLATFSEDPSGTCRTFLSPPMSRCHQEIGAWLGAAGAKVRIDAAGNLRGLYAAEKEDAARLLMGSHLDTVPNAGAYDGILGVVLAVTLLEALHGRKLPFGIEVAGFSEEEGVRFGTPFIGSRALVGRLDDALLSRRDAAGISVRAAIERFGLNPNEIADALLHPNTAAYLEFHIEQGPMLESLQRPLGVVEAVAGQTRMEFIFCGHANHAGTTPMSLRRDAIAAAAEWTLAVERTALELPDLVATVGQIVAEPGAVNVIAGEARAMLDVRHKSDAVRRDAVAALIQRAEEIAARRRLSIRHSVLLNQEAVAMDPFLTNQIEAAIRRSGCEPFRMTSGAGHDAMIIAEQIPAAMIFLRTPGGISHEPSESVESGDVAKAIETGLHLLEQLADSAEFQKRTGRA
jgi:allantoate deiminase